MGELSKLRVNYEYRESPGRHDFAYWKSLENANWPVFYLVDRTGMIRGKIVGEMHEGTRRAEWFETLLVHLLEEKPSLNGATPSE